MRFKTAALAILLFSFHARAQQPEMLWFRTTGASGQVASSFEGLVFTYLNNAGRLIRQQPVDLASLRRRLLSIRQAATPAEITIHCSLADYLQILRDPAMKDALADLHLDLANARLFTVPFYLLKEH
jgi:hypothetical protein